MTGTLHNLFIFFGSPVPGRVTATMRGATTRGLGAMSPRQGGSLKLCDGYNV